MTNHGGVRHLSNEGVEETPPSRGAEPVDRGRSSQESLFVDLDGANVGLQNWHPVAVTNQGGRLSGRAEMGGVWEWTSTILAPHDGFKPMALYPGYTGKKHHGRREVRASDG